MSIHIDGELPDDAVQAMRHAASRTGQTENQVMADALRIYDALTEAHGEGWDLYVQNEDGDLLRVDLDEEDES